ncbi:hypothetical protein OAF98_03765 [Planctomicrobium sp.]|jgi:hypothetical protein|nr:hypothetical protein [Planctomicrobium sp.]MBT5018879.1 hypothetical protein [Planctomicrobium sp.]MDA7503417.1 hypothetical protein [bacterium]MDB4743581.1 hypothetical protein [Planctomicrobium sp.]
MKCFQFFFEVLFAHCQKNLHPDVAGKPAAEAMLNGVPFAVAFRQLEPGDFGLQ